MVSLIRENLISGHYFICLVTTFLRGSYLSFLRGHAYHFSGGHAYHFLGVILIISQGSYLSFLRGHTYHFLGVMLISLGIDGKLCAKL